MTSNLVPHPRVHQPTPGQWPISSVCGTQKADASDDPSDMTSADPTGPAGARIRVLMADDHPMYRAGVADAIKRRPELELVEAVGDGRAALAAIREHEPDVALLDLQMPELDGTAVLGAVIRDRLPTRVMLVSGYFDSAVVYEALGAGAAGFLSKDSSGREICEGIEAVARGETVIDRQLQALLASEIQRRTPSDEQSLTARELEVLRMTAAGQSAPEIAAELHLGASTVKTHLQRVYDKLGVTDRAAAVAEGMRRGLIE